MSAARLQMILGFLKLIQIERHHYELLTAA
jgi:hypothetical protein